MPWLDLHTEVLIEFRELACPADDIYDTGRRLESQIRRSDPVAWAHEYAQEKRRRRVRREARAAARPPCPHCAGPVTRLGPTGKIPKYCKEKCARSAKFARWHERHGAERNARRRKAP